NSALIDSLEPDEVVVATGAENYVPGLTGQVGTTQQGTDIDLLNGRMSIAAGDDFTVFDREGQIRGVLAAIVAAEAGARVRLLTPLQSAAADLDPTQLPFMLTRLRELGG